MEPMSPEPAPDKYDQIFHGYKIENPGLLEHGPIGLVIFK